MGSVFAGRTILEVFLQSAGVGGDVAPTFANRLPACGVEKVHMASVFASPGVVGKVAPPFANRLPARWYLNRSITIMRAKQVLLNVLERKPARCKKNGGLGGGAQTPPFAHTTSLSHVLKGPYGFCFC